MDKKKQINYDNMTLKEQFEESLKNLKDGDYRVIK